MSVYFRGEECGTGVLVVLAATLLASSAHANKELPGASSVHAEQKLPSGNTVHEKQELPDTSSEAEEQLPPGANSVYAEQKLPSGNTVHEEQELPDTSSEAEEQLPPGANSVYVEQKLPSGNTVHEEQELPDTSSEAKEQLPPSASSMHAEQKLPSGNTVHEEQELPDASSEAQKKQLPPGASSVYAEQKLPSGNTVHEEQELPDTSSEAEEQLPHGANSVYAEQKLPSGNTVHEEQELPDTSSEAEEQLPPGASSLFTEQGLPDTSSEAEEQLQPGALHCQHPRCRYVKQKTLFGGWKRHHYKVEGKTIKIVDSKASGPPTLWIKCNRGSILHSPALPSFASPRQLQAVRFVYCPPPIAGSLADTLAILNVTVCEREAPNELCELALYYSPAAPPLAAEQFTGLERLQSMTVIYKANNAKATRGFLTPLKSLHRLTLRNVTLVAGELDAVSPSLEELVLLYTGTKRLPKVIYSSANLRKLKIADIIPLDAVAVPPGLRDLNLVSPATTLRLDDAPALQKLRVHNWVEPLPGRLARCDALREFRLKAPTMRALPDKWLADCRFLQVLVILEARNLITLPLQLFPTINRLTTVVFKRGALETLPYELLEHPSSLRRLDFNSNRIKMLPGNISLMKYHSRLSIVNLASNDFDGSVLTVLKPLWSVYAPQLVELNLSHNPRIGDVCDADGYSPIRYTKTLRNLYLSDTGVSRICKDWREDIQNLTLLDLRNTKISVLSIEDLQFNRTEQTRVLLRGAPVAAVRVTREEFKEARLVPPSLTSVQMDAELECDCHLYWARRALEHPRAQHALPGVGELRCLGHGLLRDSPPDDMVCPAREECAAAATIPTGCQCAACPDDDVDQDRWVVRVRCENTSQNLVPRRFYPVYLLYRSNNEGFYFTQRVILRTNDT